MDNNNCAYEADTISLPDSHPNDGSTVQKISYKNCLDEKNVVFYKIINGGHGWPGSTEGMYPEGKPNRDINASSIILNFFKNYDNPHVNLAYGKAIKCNTKFISPINNNKLDLVATVHNPENHQVEPHATILLGDSVIADSIKLYDDGSHNDEIALDNVFSSQISVAAFFENFYKINLYTTDHDESITIVCPNEEYFTTAGPIEFGSTDIDTLSDGRIALKNFELVNRGNEVTVENIGAELTTLDTNIEFTSSLRYFGDITAGGSKTIPAAFAFIAENDAQLIEFEIKIKSNNLEYWTDSFILDVTNLTDLDRESTGIPIEYSLEQNYPNPFNPSTTIKYEIPSSSVILSKAKNLKDFSSQASQNDNAFVTLKVYDILGREVATLVNENHKPGNYEVELDGSELTSGIYFYRLQAGDFIETKKMILLR